MTRHSYAKISDSLLDIFNATEIGTTTTLRDDDLSNSNETSFTGLEWSNSFNTDNASNDTDYLDEGDDPVEQRQFHRISGILSQLIREANKAINSTPSSLSTKHSTTINENTDDKPPMKMESQLHTDKSAYIMEKILSTATAINTIPVFTPESNDTLPPQLSNNINDDVSATIKETRRRSRLPRPKKLSLESFSQHYHDHHQHQNHLQRNRAFSNASSTMSSTTSTPNLDEDNTLFSPVASSLTTPMSRTISPLFLEKEQRYSQASHNNSNDDLNGGFIDNSYTSSDNKRKQRTPLDHDDDKGGALSLTDSFERLDYSLAKVDTLSRDLANYRRKHPRSSNNNLLNASGAATIATTTTTAAAEVPGPPPLTFMSSDKNTTANQHQHQPKTMCHSDGWAVLLMTVLPLGYIPYSFVLALWEKWTMAASVAGPTTTAPLDLLSTTISAVLFGGDSKISRALMSSSTATQIIPLAVGLSVYSLFMVILHLLIKASKPSSATLIK